MKANGKTDDISSPHEESEDSSIIKRILNGEKALYETLVSKHKIRLYRLVLSFVRDHDTADEISQEAFVKAFFSLHTFKQGYAFYPWLSKIAVNLALNHLKKTKRTMEIKFDDMTQEETKGYSPKQAENVSAIPKNGENPLSLLEKCELSAQMEKAILSLPIHQRSVFLLRVEQDASYKEIAKTLKISIGTVMSRLARARETLKKTLIKYLEP